MRLDWERMDSRSKLEDIRIELPKVLVALVAGQLLIKLFLLNWYPAEYTDSIIQLTLFENEATFFPPLFPALSRMIELFAKDPIFAGRLISIIASTLTLIPIYLIGKRVWSQPAGLLACLCYSVSAMHWRWSVRAMTDPLFTLLFMMAVFAFVQSFLGRDKMQLWYCLFWTGCTILTRYQGLILIPMIVLAWFRCRRSTCSSWFMVGALVPWVFLVWWQVMRGFGHTGQFQERAVGGVGNVLLAYLTMAEGFIAYLPYALTYPLFVALVIGLVKGMAMPKGQVFGLLTLYIFLPWLVIHSAFQSFQYRYFLPMLPLFCLWAGEGLCRVNKGAARVTAVILVSLWGVVFAVSVLVCQRDTFADMRATAEFLKESDFGNVRVFSDEVYRPGMENIKMQYWSGEWIYPLAKYVQDIEPEDIIVLSNVYSNFEPMAALLRERFEFREIFRAQTSIVPLLPDIMVTPPVTSQPSCMAYRYSRQNFLSVVLRIEHVK